MLLFIADCNGCGSSADGFVRGSDGSLYATCIGCVGNCERWWDPESSLVEVLSLEDEGLYEEWSAMEVLRS